MDVQTYNIAALSGLNIRDTMSLYGGVISRTRYNDEINIITDDVGLPAVIDNLIGNWMPVESSRGGYLFNGYLVSERMPNQGESIRDYANSLGYSSTRNESELELEEAYMSPSLTVQEGFLIARVLFGMSPELTLPPIINEHNIISERPPNENIWEERLTVSRDKWELTSIDYMRIYEGGALTGSIILAGDDGVGVDITYRAIAD